MKLFPPLKKMRVTQPFGVNWLPKDNSFQYADFGMDGHNGIDFRCYYKRIYASADGEVQTNIDSGYGKNVRLWIDEGGGNRLEVTHGHLFKFKAKGKVKRGETIAISGNSGYSTGPHLHYGTRPWNKKGVVDYSNGFLGYVDPAQYLDADVFVLPVLLKYGQKQMHMSLVQWYEANAWFYRETGSLMTKAQKYAFVYGYWSFREVMEPSMYETWSQMTKPAYLKKLGKL